MTIRYTNGQIFEAVLLSRTETTMRLALQGHEDVVALTLVNDVWVSDECEPVQVHFAWTRHCGAAAVAEADYICSRDLAAHLIHLLYAGDEEVATGTIPVPRSHIAAALHQVI
jgi:hypothetical protein